MSDLEHVAKSLTEEWEDSKCWFCKSRAAEDDAQYSLDLYRVLECKKTYVGVGFSHKQKYETTKTWVPRCSKCQTVHDKNDTFFIATWLILFIVAIILMIFLGSKGEDTSIVGLVFGIIMTGIVLIVVIGGIRDFTSRFWKSESYALEHPRVKKVIEQGWKEGTSPPYKRGF